jgi:hypothetical protein
MGVKKKAEVQMAREKKILLCQHTFFFVFKNSEMKMMHFAKLMTPKPLNHVT